METPFTELVGCRLPLQQAGMGGTATPELALAVSEAGGLGMLGLAGAPARVVAAATEALSARTTCPFGVNFLIPFLDRDAVAAAADRARVVEFFYGDPDPDLVALAHRGGTLVSWQVGSVEEARQAADSGCDLIVVQGVEAGGHVRGQVGLLALLDVVLEVVSVPVVAAGGLGSGRAVAGVMAAGASAVRIGTRFLAAEEADVHPAYLDALVHARAADTELTTTFSLQWPNAPHRVLRSSIAAVLQLNEDVVGQTELAPGVPVTVARLSPLSPGRAATGHVEAMAQYAGQSVDHVRGRVPAAQIVDELTALL